ncbi:MAG: VOC family protein [Candidatus Synoicihabitans palmerolidicus]|nr:VOC family protein [Candidatus Synoicihabitans palmerolidicus]
MKLMILCGLFLVLLSSVEAEATSEGKSDLPAKGLIPQKRMLHIGIVVKNMDAALVHWTKVLGRDEIPETILAEEHHANPTMLRSQPSAAKVRLAFIQLDNIQVELLQPVDDEPNAWQEFLDTHGERVHHIAFAVKGLGETYVGALSEAGMPLLMSGGWDGGEYIYADTHDALDTTVELLETYTQPTTAQP